MRTRDTQRETAALEEPVTHFVNGRERTSALYMHGVQPERTMYQGHEEDGKHWLGARERDWLGALIDSGRAQRPS